MAKDFAMLKLKGPDEFQSIAGRWLGILVAHQREVWISLGALVLISLGVVYWNGQMEQKNEAAALEFAAVLETFPKDQAKHSDWELFLGTLDTFIKGHEGRSMISSAHLYRGKALLSLGRYQDAMPAYQAAQKELPLPARYLALEGEGYALMELTRWNEAEAIWKKLSQAQENPNQVLHTWNLGLTQESAKRVGPALATYQEFEKKYPNSDLAEQVRARIAALRTSPATP